MLTRDHLPNRSLEQKREEPQQPLLSACAPGYFENNFGNCRPCSQGCKQCMDKDTCTSCYSGFTMSYGTCSCNGDGTNYEGTQCLTCSTGSYYSSTLQRCVDCSANCEVCTGRKECTQCATNFTLSARKVCQCDGFTNIMGDCFVCSEQQYYDGYQCGDCGYKCSSCSSPSGYCTTCEDTYTFDVDGACACQDPKIDNGTQCVEL